MVKGRKEVFKNRKGKEDGSQLTNCLQTAKELAKNVVGKSIVLSSQKFSGMSKKLRMTVPSFWVLVVFVAFQDSCSSSQFCRTDQEDFHNKVSTENLFSDIPVRHCTVNQSCDSDNRMATLTSEQKAICITISIL